MGLPSSAGGLRVLDARSTGKALSGFLLSGFLFALLGPLLPAWGYHLGSGFVTVGNYFLSLALGVMAAGLVWRRILTRTGLAHLFVLACSLACGSLAYLANASPPAERTFSATASMSESVASALITTTMSSSVPLDHGPPGDEKTPGPARGRCPLLSRQATTPGRARRR